jgi:hypothetical protein
MVIGKKIVLCQLPKFSTLSTSKQTLETFLKSGLYIIFKNIYNRLVKSKNQVTIIISEGDFDVWRKNTEGVTLLVIKNDKISK